mgnify:CR=1 FL=1
MDEEQTKASLSEPQFALMRVLWEQPDSNVAQIVESVRKVRPLAHTTIATMLTRLEKRGLVKARKDGRQLFYSATVSEDEVQKSMLAELLTSAFLGNARALLSHLVNEETVSEQDLIELRQKIKQKREQ